MKKLLVSLMTVLIVLSMLTACTSDTSTDANKTDGKLSIVCTIFPIYDWTREILADKFENTNLTMLLDNGVDLHNFQPTADDIVKISSCDVFIYVGGESDKWVDSALSAANTNVTAINLMSVLSDEIVEEEPIGVEEEEEEEEEIEYDEHVWLSLENAEKCCKAICEAIKAADSENADAYEKAYEAYTEKLSALDEKYEDSIENGKNSTLVVADRYPFRYLFDDYDLKCFAAFSGCSAETEASFETIAFLAGKTDELGLKNIIVLEGSDESIAKTIIENTKDKNQNILTLDSMQSTTKVDAENGVTYLSVMEMNIRTLAEAVK